MKNENSVMAILAAAVGALCSYAAALVVPLAVLLAVMFVSAEALHKKTAR